MSGKVDNNGICCRCGGDGGWESPGLTPWNPELVTCPDCDGNGGPGRSAMDEEIGFYTPPLPKPRKRRFAWISEDDVPF